MLLKEKYQASQNYFGFCFVLKSRTTNNLSNCPFSFEQWVIGNSDMTGGKFTSMQEMLARGINLYNAHNYKI